MAEIHNSRIRWEQHTHLPRGAAPDFPKECMSYLNNTSPGAMRKLITALEEHGCKPVEVSAGRWIALCPCCGRLDLTLGHDGPVTGDERDGWLDAA